MAVEITPEMRVAFAAMRQAGVEFEETRRVEMACGCRVSSGWVVEAMEPGVRVYACAEHEAAARRAAARWADPDVQERSEDLPAVDALATLHREEIAR